MPRFALPLAVCCLASPALAFTESGSAPLPTFAANPQFSERAAGGWSAMSTGAPFAPGRFGFSGLTDARTFTAVQPLSKNITFGVQTTTGYAPSVFLRGPALGHDFSATSFKFDYNMGRLTPFVSGTVVSARPNSPDGLNFGLPGVSTEAKTAGTISGGFDYAVTDKFSFGVAVSAGNMQRPR
jgi:hypothetical protein